MDLCKGSGHFWCQSEMKELGLNGLSTLEGKMKTNWSSLQKTLGKHIIVLQPWFQMSFHCQDVNVKQSSDGCCCEDSTVS